MIARLVIVNALGWAALQLIVARIFVLLPDRLFVRAGQPAPSHKTELHIYQHWLLVKRWKNLLPDGGRWVGGSFSKQRLTSHDRDYLRRFVLETRRGEATHWTAIALAPLFFLWNPMPVWWVLVVVALVLNLPCIIVQRFNHFKLAPLI